MNTKPDQLAQAIADTLQTFEETTEEAMVRAVNNTAEKAAEIVKAAALHFGENYAQDIRPRKGRLTKKRGGSVHAYVTAGNHYRVAHLLEHGHAKVAGGRVTGFVEGYEHFAKGEDYVERNLVENIRKEIQA